MPTPVLSNLSPYEKLFNKPPNHSFLQVFGCACFPNLHPYNKNKLQPRSIRWVFLGYLNMHKGYKCLHLDTGRLYISRDVVFNEFDYPLSKSVAVPTLPATSLPLVVNTFPTAPFSTYEWFTKSTFTPYYWCFSLTSAFFTL